MVARTSRSNFAVAVGRVLLGATVVMLFAGAKSAPAQLSGPVVSYAGAVNQDGCPDCCEFSCRTTPTPVPQFDSLGRRVFERSAGRFLFIVEAALGSSFQSPSTAGTRRGSVIEPLGSFTRPGVQLVFDRPLGDGNPAVECGTNLIGGVPSALGLTEPQRTNAMRDVACRFEWVPYTDACTRNRFGGFATLSGDTLTQYCFQVPDSADFPVGDTVVGIQMMDRLGNLGPPEEVVIRVGVPGAPTATPPPTPTPGATYDVGGVIAHFSGGRPVGGVRIVASSGATVMSDGSGGYLLSDLPAATVQIVPRKDGDVASAVTALDAAWILQRNAGKRTFTATQRLACDVTGNGAVSGLDATEILKRVAGLTPRLPVAASALCNSDWAFQPAAAVVPNQLVIPPSSSTGGCISGSIRYSPLSVNAANQSFTAVPFGDCTGNWQSSGGAALATAGANLARLGTPRRGRSPRVRIPVYLESPRPFHAAVIDISYDAGELGRPRLRRTRALDGAVVLMNDRTPGQLRVAIASGSALAAGELPVAILEFRAARGPWRRGGGGAEIRAAVIE